MGLKVAPLYSWLVPLETSPHVQALPKASSLTAAQQWWKGACCGNRTPISPCGSEDKSPSGTKDASVALTAQEPPRVWGAVSQKQGQRPNEYFSL